MDPIDSKDGVEFDAVSRLLLVKSAKHKRGAPQGASSIFSRFPLFFLGLCGGAYGLFAVAVHVDVV